MQTVTFRRDDPKTMVLPLKSCPNWALIREYRNDPARFFPSPQNGDHISQCSARHEHLTQGEQLTVTYYQTGLEDRAILVVNRFKEKNSNISGIYLTEIPGKPEYLSPHGHKYDYLISALSCYDPLLKVIR